MPIFVSGGTGFLGRHLVWRLVADGHQVVFSGRDQRVATDVINAARAPQQVRFARIDHGSDSAARAVLDASAGAQAIVHCAALASPWGARAAFRRANVDATAEVLAACRTHGIARLVHISSPSIYFRFADCLQIAEHDALPPPVNEYARTKYQAEQLIQAAHLPAAAILRPRAIFGPWDNALLPRLLRLMQYGRVPLLRGGRALLDMTYVDNVVDAIVSALTLPASETTPVFNITNGEPIAAAELFSRIATQFNLPVTTAHRPYVVADLAARALELAAQLRPGWEPPFTRYSLGAIAFSQTLDLQRARAVLGYQPRVSLADGMARTAQWWRLQKASQ
ncbi:NAD-dependent epimerase/dehydratase family protein [Herbaspirillum autotrophicum]|uniref:NAD-dependent epimerase/dehydratase family protein n=1 Tax=Herbaspirillum autotrophicum TaxID=180195 RepID=UPI00067C0884|nr:NAD(P)-dependent oxidoreductase [Herbaspirillum autotrophicum]